MKLTVTKHDHIHQLALADRFDAHGVPVIQTWLKENLSDAQPRVLVDLRNVHFIDSAALALLVSGKRLCRELDGDLYLCGLTQPARIIFELTQLDRAFTIFANEQEALNSLDGDDPVSIQA